MSASNGESDVVQMLIPIDPTSREVLTERPTLPVGPLYPMFFLGDNDDTEIVDPKLSSKVVKIYEKRGKVFAFCCHDGRGAVKLNAASFPKGGRRELHEGDIITLSCDDDGEYCYRLGQVDGDALAAGSGDTGGASVSGVASSAAAAVAPEAAARSVSAVEGGGETKAQFPPQVGEDAMCAICMEILFDPRTIVPCGHSFCRLCLANQTECAECRGTIQGQVICRSLQNLIDGLVDVSTKQGIPVFAKDDLDSYASRKNSGSAVSRPNMCKKRRLLDRGADSLWPATGSTSNVIYLS